jgi:hypothetical protein
MAQGSYLEQIARRAVQDTPGLLPRRPRARALRATPPDEPVSAEQMPRPVSSGMPAADPIPSRAPTPIGATPWVSIEPETPSEPAASVVSEAVATPSRAGVVPEVIHGDAPPARDATSQTRPAGRIQQPPEREDFTVADAPTLAPPPPSLEPRRPAVPQRNIAVVPDPLAVALAAAVRWTASDNERPGPIAAARVQRERPAGRGGPAAVPPRAIRGRDAAAPPPHDDAPPVRRDPRADPVAATSDHRSAPAPAAERFAGVHIGSVEVQILAPSVQPAIARRPGVSSGTPAAPLTRGLSSAIGLHQS